jgi:glucosamine--fructose-6-phosphate aminotransferase (isomerizing)
MCGIIAYSGYRDAFDILLKGLKRLEYRGYDSAGIAIFSGGLKVLKKKGRVEELEELSIGHKFSGHTGIGHTRWATHGEPNDVNAHPHLSSDGKLALIHNGIIENYHSIKKELEAKGHFFKGETDTEILVHFIEEIQNNNKCPLEEAVRIALNRVVGAYAIVILSENEPETLITARKGSPLVIGHGKDEFFIASDASPIIEYTKDVTYLGDNEMAVIKDQKLAIKNLENIKITPFIHKLDMELESIEKNGFDHFMIKEIFEQPKSIKDSFRGRLNAGAGEITLGGLSNHLNDLIKADRIIMLACGTSWHACMVAEYFFEEHCKIPVEVEYASEFRYRNPVIRAKDVFIAVSQSGETADTLAAIELAKSKGSTVIGICNVVGSSVPRATDEGAYTHAGPEIGVASTKAFTAQLTVLFMIGLKISFNLGYLTEARFKKLLTIFELLPEKVEEVLKSDGKIKQLASLYKDAKNFLYLGRGYNFPVALEGALKLKEISYIHAEGYPAAEMKHGPIALIDKNMPVVFIATQDSTYDKIIANIREIKARKGKIIAIITEGDTFLPSIVDHYIEIPAFEESFYPILTVVPLQLLAYHIAVMRGCDVDKPRNLAKSVTVE